MKKFIRIICLSTLPFCVKAQPPAYNAVYQYSVPVGPRQAYCWIPPTCKQVRGVIISLSNLLERSWLEDPLIRRTAAEEGLAIIWIGVGGGSKGAALTADLAPEGGEALQQMMKDLAAVSGYPELEWAPFIAMGHSANGHFAWRLATWDPERTIAAIPIKTIPLPDSLAFTNVPLCYIVGETTEWPQYRDGRPGDRDFFWPVVRNSAVHLRSANEHHLVSVVTDPGGGHFDWSPRLARFVALYIHKACEYRLPAKSPVTGPVTLKKIALTTGWLTDTQGMMPDSFPPAPYKDYKGDPARTYWFFDKETALAAAAFEGDRKPRKKQMLTFIQDDKLLPVAKLGFAALQFQPEQDGLSFRLEPGFLTTMPDELTKAGTPLGHAPGPIRLRVITGPVIQLSPDSFRIQFDRNGLGGDAWIQEEQDGDDTYRHAVQPAKLHIPSRLTEGTPQHISFPAIPDQKTGTAAINLGAVTDSGLPVDYYVVSGPAVIEGHTLYITPIPVKSRYPVKITVVAYQWGRTVAPLFSSADPITMSFSLIK